MRQGHESPAQRRRGVGSAAAPRLRASLRHALIGAAIVLGTSLANGALTSSERGQIKDFVASAKAENAQRVRALVARTDLTPEESISVLTEAVSRLAFTEQRGVFLKELVFGGTSAPSRPILTLATVKALLARADAVYQRYVGGLDHEPRAIQELVAIYAWLDATIANAGKPTAAAHDASAGIPPATYEECSKVLRDHLERNARWLKGDGSVPASIAGLRAQAQVLLVDMLPDGLTRRVDAADRIALQGARRKMLSEWGVLLADDGKLEDAKVERVRQILGRLPGARADVAMIYVGPDHGVPLRARGAVLQVTPGAERWPFADESAPAVYDPATSAIVHELAVVAARRALERRAELRAQAELDANAASGDLQRLLGRPHAPSVEHVIGAAIHTLLTDAPRAVDFSASRFAGSRPETPALLSDALGALAAQASEDGKDTKAAKIELAKASGFTTASAVRLAPNGVALGFTLEGRSWAIDRPGPTYKVVGVRRDGTLVRPKPAPAPAAPTSSKPAPSAPASATPPKP